MAVNNNFLHKVLSSFAEFAEYNTDVGTGAVYNRLLVLKLAEGLSSRQVTHHLTNSLIRIAEHSVGLRDTPTIEWVAKILSNLPAAEAKHLRDYYSALAMKRRGRTDEARILLEKVADSSIPLYRSRAIQTLGVIEHEQGNLDEAERLYLQAICSSHKQDLITRLSACETLNVIKSSRGDHKGALNDLQSLWPAFKVVSGQHPYSFYLYHADLAYELAQVGRISEAEASIAVALNSPFAAAYPEWSETRNEIAAKRQAASHSQVAIQHAPRPRPSQLSPRKLKKAGALGLPPHKRDHFQEALRISAAKVISPFCIPSLIIRRVRKQSRPRSPPAVR